MTGNLKMNFSELINKCNNGMMNGYDMLRIGFLQQPINFTAD